MVDPYDLSEMTRGIAALDADADLRADLSPRGVERANLFSMEAYARRVADVYKQLT
jgi:glycosyltransferase involved in cell wall biosynthesis